MYIANYPFNKMKILSLEKSFPMMYSNLCLSFRATVPLIIIKHAVIDTQRGRWV